MVYQRDQVNKTFKPKPYFELNAEILANQQKFVAKLDPYQRFKDEAGLMTFMQAKKRASPQLFSLSSLQSAMNKRYHASASQTLAAIQSLYEAKLLSYPRTDCAYITDEEFDYLVANLTKYLGLVSKPVALTNTTPNKRYVDGKRVEEHYAIIMTKVVPTKEKLASLPKLQQQVYDLVLRTTLAMFADPYEYEETTIITQVGDVNFKATGKVPTKQGWQALFDDHKSEVIATFAFIFVLLNLGNFTQGLKPFIVGLVITVVGTCLGTTTGFALNPARDWSPRLAYTILPVPNKGAAEWWYAWVPMCGPIVGGIIACALQAALA